MEDDNNIFGFVSKIGSFLNSKKSQEKDNKKNNKNKDKKYNIKISTDDEQEINIIDKDGEEEEEEEEEDEKVEEKKINPEAELEKEKIKNLVQEIMENNDKNPEEEEEEIENENNINNDNNDIINENNITNNSINNEQPKIKTSIPIMNNSFPPNDSNKGFIYDDTLSCHIMLKKGNDFNINDYIVFPITFMEKSKSIFYIMKMTNNLSYEPKNYLLFFDEHFIYLSKDEIVYQYMEEDTRT